VLRHPKAQLFNISSFGTCDSQPEASVLHKIASRGRSDTYPGLASISTKSQGKFCVTLLEMSEIEC
jgi:hypothetical protein